MLSTEGRNTLVDRVNALDFTFQTLDPQVKVYRYGEGFSRENPTILVQFLPANRKKFQSISDVIGKVPGAGDHYQYGFCQIELVTIHVYCQEKHESADKTTVMNGRVLCEFLADEVLRDVLREWETILLEFNASFDRKETIAVKDLSTYDPVTETRIYNYDIDVYLRTQFRWDKVPDGYDEDADLANILSVEELKE